MPSALALLLVGSLIFFVLLFVAIVIHEAGHVAAGLLCGFRVMGIWIGPLKLDLSGHTALKLSSAHLQGGAVFAQFRERPGRYAGWRVALFLLGGSVANIAFLAVPILLERTSAGGISSLIAVVSVLVGVINLFPFTSRRGLKSDGAKLFGILTSKKRRDALIARFTIQARIQEVSKLCRAEQFSAAYPKLEELIALFQSIAPATACWDYLSKLSRLKEQIGRRIGAETCAPLADVDQMPVSL